MINNRKYKLKNLAEFIASEYEEKITPLEKITAEEDLEVFYDRYEVNSFDGMTFYDHGKFFIHLNLDNHNSPYSERGRFTLAHELGHYFIDSHRIGLKRGILKPHPSQTNQKQFYSIEREADYFASCLLMPEFRFCKDVGNMKFSFEMIDYLRREYGVSRTACALRFADIGNHPIMIVYAENNQIKWSYSSEDFPYKSLINGAIVPLNTNMGDYFRTRSSNNLFETNKVWAIDVFQYVKNDDVRRQFYEHCITHKDCALSLFWED